MEFAKKAVNANAKLVTAQMTVVLNTARSHAVNLTVRALTIPVSVIKASSALIALLQNVSRDVQETVFA